MSGLGELDRPGTPGSAEAWDARSEQWLEGRGEPEAEAGAEAVAPGELSAAGRHGSGSGDDRGAGARDEAPMAEGPDAGDVCAAVDLDEALPAAGQGTGDVRAAVDLDEAPPATGQDANARTTPAPRPSVGARQPHPDAAPAPTPRAADRKAATPARRGAADPVKALMHRHRELCERAVDPLEIAAGLEAHGVTDRTAARFRHRDVFSLAEEMYARVSRDDVAPAHADPVTEPAPRATWALLALLPGVLCAAAVTGVRLTDGRLRLTVAVVGVLAVALGVRVALRRGPLSSPPGTHTWRTPPGTRLWTYWLLAYALLGDGLLRAADDGGPDGLPTGLAGGLWPTATAPVLALTVACAPAAWCAHHFAVRARRKLATSRGLEDFADSVQPLLLGTFALFVCALTALLALSGAVLGEPAAYAQGITLGALLLLARLLTVHGFTHAPTVALGAAAVTEATALAVDLIGRLPGCGFLAAPVETVLESVGPGGIPALACGAAALILLFHTTRTLTRASAHAPANEPR
ncbi:MULTISPECIES: hypothetical protein [unclassified Streptomyces]|uniref:hypothetical protein n=1 Tax=unclassified Streptomyces TaxID=2593676 RepID=UPI002E2D9413|nr:hypothetical protein [Streptomyces sp. NBC_00228]